MRKSPIKVKLEYNLTLPSYLVKQIIGAPLVNHPNGSANAGLRVGDTINEKDAMTLASYTLVTVVEAKR